MDQEPQPQTEQIAEHEERLDRGAQQFAELSDRMHALERRSESMDAKLDQVCEVLGVYRNVKGFIAVMGWIGVGLKWCWWIGLLLLAVWALARTGQWTPPRPP